MLVAKPAGPTSHDIVDMARRALNEKRIGHLGTLDPFAKGLLVLLVGRATRLAPFAAGWPKSYDGIIRLGVELGVDYSLTHSCYNPRPDGRPCQQCDSCQFRARGFEEAGLPDPLLSVRA